MHIKNLPVVLSFVVGSALLAASPMVAAEVCSIAGPQAPRDVDLGAGTNSVLFDYAPASETMNLCNIHFHSGAEHRSADYSHPVLGDDGKPAGWACSEAPKVASKAKKMIGSAMDTGCSDVTVGDTIEVHWVYTTCETGPGAGLGNCVSCPEEGRSLRVEARVFELAEAGADFSAFDYLADSSPAQPASLPAAESSVRYLGSTTGPSYDAETCSPYEVSWSVSQSCEPLAISTLHSWCNENAFEEDHAHGVRQLVTDPALLSALIK